ncbi:hypothetical protein BD560DRAFT_316973, partial [Blakeslea trispora]
LKKKARNYRVDEKGELYRLFRNERIVHVPRLRERAELITTMYDQHGHYGQDATWARLYKRYWWPTAYEDLRQYIKSCHACQVFSNVPNKMVLKGNIPTHHLFERFAIDYIGPFPTTISKNMYIILAVDCYSRWPIAKAVKPADSKTMVKFMYDELFTVHGCPT